MSDMLRKGIIVKSSSAWLAPAVYTRKKTGEIRLWVDYRKVNKRTSKDAYPLPLIDEVQDRLSGAMVFSKLDHQCGYWQVPVHPKDQEKTAFSPGLGMGLFQFTRMPGLWLVWDTQHIPEINGCRVVKGPTQLRVHSLASLHVG